MKLTLNRNPSGPKATIGDLLVDGEDFCHTLEDVVRQVHDKPVGDWKIPGQTAIPTGNYRVSLTPSQRFKRVLPLLESVPGFEGIRIHPGNTDADTEGCILVGVWKGQPDFIEDSRHTFDQLMHLLQEAETPITIEVCGAET